MKRIAGLLCLALLLFSGSIDLMAEEVYFSDPNLKRAVEITLNMQDPTPSDMLWLEHMTSFSHNAGIKDLEGLQYAKNLKVIWLHFNEIEDITPLSSLVKLESLTLDYNKISNISPLMGLVNLVHLNLSSNRISDISSLAGLQKLWKLYLADNHINDLSPLSNLTELIHLWLHGNDITDLSPLARLTNLENLMLSENWYINDISVLGNLVNLQVLDVSFNQVADIEVLTELRKLKQLYLYSTFLNDAAYQTHIPLIEKNNPGIFLQIDPFDDWALMILMQGNGEAKIGEGNLAFTFSDNNYISYGYPNPPQVPIEATPAPGHTFKGWSGTAVDAGRVANPNAIATTVLVDSRYTLEVKFSSDAAFNTISIQTNCDQAQFSLSGREIEIEGKGLYWSRSGLPLDEYTVTFHDVPGYLAPGRQTRVLTPTEPLDFVGTYIHTGSARLNIDTIGAQGQIYIDGWYKGIESWTGAVEAGQHIISFGAVPGYITPGDQIVTIPDNGEKSCAGIYVSSSGYGNIEIQTNVYSASFTIIGPETYYGSGMWWKKENVPEGEYIVYFDDEWMHRTPEPYRGGLKFGETLKIIRDYISLGELKVVVRPESVNGEIFVDNDKKGEGNWVGHVTAGQHIISFGEYPGYEKPDDQIINVRRANEMDEPIIGEYKPLTNTVAVNTNIDDAEYTIYGPEGLEDHGKGKTAVFIPRPLGAYTIVYADIEGYCTPPDETILLLEDGTATFHGTYYIERLSIPFYNQHSTQWCWACSIANASSYICDTRLKPWQIACNPRFQEKPDMKIANSEMAGRIKSSLEKDSKHEWNYKNYEYWSDIDDLKYDTIQAINRKSPVYMGTRVFPDGYSVFDERIGHAFLIVGANESHVWIHNTGRINNAGIFDTVGPNLRVSWDDFADRVSVVYGRILTMDGIEKPSKPLTLSMSSNDSGIFLSPQGDLNLCWDGRYKYGYVFVNSSLPGVNSNIGEWVQWDLALPAPSEPPDSEFFQYPTNEFSLSPSFEVCNVSESEKNYTIRTAINNDIGKEIYMFTSSTPKLVRSGECNIISPMFEGALSLPLSGFNTGRYTLQVELIDMSTMEVNDNISIYFKIGTQESRSVTEASLEVTNKHIGKGESLTVDPSNTFIKCDGDIGGVTYCYEVQMPDGLIVNSPAYNLYLYDGINYLNDDFQGFLCPITGTVKFRLVIISTPPDTQGDRQSSDNICEAYEKKYLLFGHILEHLTNKPIEKVNVSFRAIQGDLGLKETVTERSGFYQFTGLTGEKNGTTYRITVSHQDYDFDESEAIVTVKSGDMTGIDFYGRKKYLGNERATIFGSITDQHGMTIGGAEIQLSPVSLVDSNMVTKTNHLGYFEFGNLEAGTYLLTPKVNGYSAQSTEITLAQPEHRRIDLALTSIAPVGNLKGRVVNNQGEWISYDKYMGTAIVYSDASCINSVTICEINEDGYILIPGLNPGTYYVEINANQHQSRFFEQVEIGSTDEVTELNNGDFIMLEKNTIVDSAAGQLTQDEKAFGSLMIPEPNNPGILSSDYYGVFSITWLHGAFEFYLVNPDGTIFTRESTKTTDGVEYYQDEGVIRFRIKDPAVGQWHYEVQCLNSTYGPADYSIYVSIDYVAFEE